MFNVTSSFQKRTVSGRSKKKYECSYIITVNIRIEFGKSFKRVSGEMGKKKNKAAPLFTMQC
jgi:hypothetical protein